MKQALDGIMKKFGHDILAAYFECEKARFLEDALIASQCCSSIGEGPQQRESMGKVSKEPGQGTSQRYGWLEDLAWHWTTQKLNPVKGP